MEQLAVINENPLNDLTEVIGKVVESQPEANKSSFDFSGFESSEKNDTDNNDSGNSNSGSDKSDTSNNGDNKGSGNNGDFAEGSAMAGLAIIITDVILSRVAGVILNWQGYQCNFKDLQLTLDERKTITPFVERLVKKYLAHMTDETALLVALAGMYGGKIAVVAMLQEPKERASANHRPATSTSNPKGAGAHKRDCTCEKCEKRRKEKEVKNVS